MKKYISMFFVVLLLTFSLSVSMMAEREDLSRVVDDADLLSDEEEIELADIIATIADTYAFDIVLLTVNSLDGSTPEAYADDYFDYNSYGYGDDSDGILFLLSMENRDWAFSTCGFGTTAFTDYGQEQIMSAITPSLSEENYNSAFSELLSYAGSYIASAKDGTPMDVGEKKPVSKAFGFLISIVVGLIVAAIITGVERYAMKTARAKTEANDYLVRDSFKLTVKEDLFLYSTTTKTEKAEPPTSTSGGSSTHNSSSGTTHGGSSGKF